MVKQADLREEARKAFILDLDRIAATLPEDRKFLFLAYAREYLNSTAPFVRLQALRGLTVALGIQAPPVGNKGPKPSHNLDTVIERIHRKA